MKTIQIGNATLYNDDCFNIFPLIPDGSIDAIISDPPYGSTKCAWDSVLDLELLWKEYKRILKPNGVVILFAQTPYDKVLGCSNLPWLKYEWIWEKTSATGHLNAKKAPMRAHENILCYYDKLPTYNPIKTTGHVRKVSSAKNRAACIIRRNAEDDHLYNKEIPESVTGYDSTERYPRSVQIFASDKQKNRLDGTIHPTQKPLALMEMLVKTYTNEGDIILDNCMGSGTTVLAAEMHKRKSIGIELSDNERLCPSCDDMMVYSDKGTRNRAENDKILCITCRRKKTKEKNIIDSQRLCPSCDILLTYSSKDKRVRADNDNALCKACSFKNRRGDKHPMFGKVSAFKGRKHSDESRKLISDNHADVSGENNPMFGTNGGMHNKKHTKATKNKIAKGNKGKKYSNETKEKISISKLEYYKNNPGTRKGMSHSDESINKMRLSRIKYIENARNNGFPIYPSYNKKSIVILDNYSFINNLTIRHAENGGEFFIRELGYWVDGYDEYNNVVIEYNEKYHKYRIDKDIKRRIEIMNLLKCDFHIIHENGEIEIFLYT